MQIGSCHNVIMWNHYWNQHSRWKELRLGVYYMHVTSVQGVFQISLCRKFKSESYAFFLMAFKTITTVFHKVVFYHGNELAWVSHVINNRLLIWHNYLHVWWSRGYARWYDRPSVFLQRIDRTRFLALAICNSFNNTVFWDTNAKVNNLTLCFMSVTMGLSCSWPHCSLSARIGWRNCGNMYWGVSNVCQSIPWC